MKIFAYAIFAFAGSAVPASAHLGHVGELAGHGHWIALGALGLAAGLAAAAAFLDRKKRREPDDGGPEPDGEETGQVESRS